MSGLTHNVSAQADELLDHIYEYGTNSEGVIHRINRLCDAAVEQLRTELAASREREARLIGYVEHLKVCAVCAESFLQDCEVGREIDAALAEGAQG